MTSIEWLINQIHKKQYRDYPNLTFENIFKEAEQMHKQEIIYAYNKSFELRDKPYSTADKYYQETFKKD